jgi:hypothetical protein
MFWTRLRLWHQKSSFTWLNFDDQKNDLTMMSPSFEASNLKSSAIWGWFPGSNSHDSRARFAYGYSWGIISKHGRILAIARRKMVIKGMIWGSTTNVEGPASQFSLVSYLCPLWSFFPLVGGWIEGPPLGLTVQIVLMNFRSKAFYPKGHHWDLSSIKYIGLQVLHVYLSLFIICLMTVPLW